MTAATSTRAGRETGRDVAHGKQGTVTDPDLTPPPELQVKSVERVRDLGEVFTPAATVKDMLDLLPDDMWAVHPSPTFLEPACGDGNFLVAILDRKLAAVADTAAQGALPAGAGKEALQFHALEALSSVYGIDISVDNVVGGTPGHEVGARDRLLAHLRRWHDDEVGGRLTERSPLVTAARWVLEHNVLVANMLPFDPDGSPSGRDDLPLVEYRWDPVAGTVTLLTTTLGAVAEAAAAETGDSLSLFGPAEPTVAWSGKALRLAEAPVPAPVPAVTHTSNRKGVS